MYMVTKPDVTKTNTDLGFSIVPRVGIPNIVKGQSKYLKLIEHAKNLKLEESMRIPLTNEKGETNRNATATIQKHVQQLTLKSSRILQESNGKKEWINDPSKKEYTYRMVVSTRTEDKKVYAYIYYELQEGESAS